MAKETRAVEILKDGLTAQFHVYMKGDIEKDPQEVLISCAEIGKTVRFVKVKTEPAPEKAPEAPEQTKPEESKEKPKKKGLIAKILGK